MTWGVTFIGQRGQFEIGLNITFAVIYDLDGLK